MDLICPACRADLRRDADAYHCAGCEKAYPVIDGVPVLINDANSVFAIDDFRSAPSYQGGTYGGVSDRKPGLRGLYRRFIRFMRGVHVRPVHTDAETAVQRLLDESEHPRILVIGAGDTSYAGADDNRGEFVYTDVAFGNRTQYICDAHDLPFEDGSFDAVLAISVLEHVVDPYRVVSEIHRVLADDGVVYAVTPFLQPVHNGAHDFTRFTYLGHRRLFRCFDDIESGMALGSWSSVAKIVAETLRATGRRGRLRSALGLFGVLLHPLIGCLDIFTRRNVAALDVASGVYFWGRRRATPIPDRDIIKLYRGGL